MVIDTQALDAIEDNLDPVVRERIAKTADLIVSAKERGRNVAVITGSGRASRRDPASGGAARCTA